MSKVKTKEELVKHKDNAVNMLNNFIENLIIDENDSSKGKADKFSYWIENYINFLEFEPVFKPNSLKRYKRGEIIKVHLGYNVGSEEGGLHYAVVLDKDNSIYSPTLSIVPLRSVKPNTNINNLHKGEVFLGNELFTNLSSKFIMQRKNIEQQIKDLKELSDKCIKEEQMRENNKAEILYRISQAEEFVNLIKRMMTEIQKMKKGSIALVSQITTVSKIRIYDPKTNMDVLSNIKLSNESLDAIDKCICDLYTNNKKNS